MGSGAQEHLDVVLFEIQAVIFVPSQVANYSKFSHKLVHAFRCDVVVHV